MTLIRLLAPLLAALSLCSTTWAARRDLPPVPGEVIVQFRDDAASLRKHALAARASAADVRSVLSQRATALGTRMGYKLEAGAAVGERMQVVRARGADARVLAAALAADPEVAFAVPNGRQRIQAAPNDPLYAAAALGVRPLGPDSGQWYLRAPSGEVKSGIDIEAAWARTRGTSSVVVAVLDTGIRFDHPDFVRVENGGNVLAGYDFVSDTVISNDGDGRDADASDPGDWVTAAEAAGPDFDADCEGSSTWHGTGTGSLIGATTDNAVGMAGSAPGVRLLPLRVLGKCWGSDSDIIAAMRWAAGLAVDGVPANANPAQVLNLSLGSSSTCSAAYQAAIDAIVARGTSVVVSAGNSAGAPVGTPGNCVGAIAVLALRHFGTKVGFSDLGPEIGISAPGGNCVNIDPGDACLYPILAATNRGAREPTTSTWTDSFDISVGTSFSAPLVAGTVALMVSQHPTITPAQVRAALAASARPFPSSGADNGPDDPSPVRQCVAPSQGVEQLQCYCTTALCGAGMVDAGAAVAAAAALPAGVKAVATHSPASPVAGAVVTVDGSTSEPAAGASITAYAWALLDGGGIVGGFNGATNAASATLTPSAAGSFTVRLMVTDSLGNTHTTTHTVTVTAAPEPPPAAGGGGGGGASSLLWVLGVVAAVLALVLTSRRDVRRRAARDRLPHG